MIELKVITGIVITENSNCRQYVTGTTLFLATFIDAMLEVISQYLPLATHKHIRVRDMAPSK